MKVKFFVTENRVVIFRASVEEDLTFKTVSEFVDSERASCLPMYLYKEALRALEVANGIIFKNEEEFDSIYTPPHKVWILETEKPQPYFIYEAVKEVERMSKTRQDYNKEILLEIDKYIEKFTDMRFIQILWSLGIINSNNGVISDRFCEESQETLEKIIHTIRI